ncbi:LysR family transcriptional regulator ArgP [Defluviimonas sp. WL0002]|uniref:LysR family transcriptional regulator ArgP n=1 Tax=Albidovulum marisflavi TaxID=2984159 RepID=A0ABT2ZBE3_9RHOB|nr:LysR family transcriptional regulator ArgP [Defluviimonas sp. WL0002]MCV2868111.1 LysR family transcriptional regulator ArgP [Defluviimonas sp. WL0002]
MFDPARLQALAAILRHGSFEAAAQKLGVTPSAISQRIRALEDQVGAPLIQRGQPCQATPAGARLARHAEDMRLLERSVAQDIGTPPPDARPVVRLAVNADSLATWFVPALRALPDVLFDLVVEDEDHSGDWLRRGQVQAAVTSHGTPIAGCDAYPLGSLRFVAAASPEFARHWFASGVNEETLSRAPTLTFNHKDRLQAEWACAQAGRRIEPPTHYLPLTQGFVDAALAGLGWALHPVSLVRGHLATGRLVPLVPDAPLDRALTWQVGRLTAGALAPLTQAVRKAAAATLQAPK